MDQLYDVKKEICEVAFTAYQEGMFAGTSGNLSYYDPELDVMCITPSGVSYRTMKPEDIMVIKLDGTVVEGPTKPSSEWRVHAAIYKMRGDVRSVFHTHSPYATGYAVTHDTIPVILIEMFPFLGGDIPLAEFGLPGSDEVADRTAAALTKRNACLMSNHGAVAVGNSIQQAYVRACYVEDAAKIYHYACTVGVPKVIEEADADVMRAKFGLVK